MSTGAIIAIAVIVAIILIALFVMLPRMRKAAAEKKAEQQRREEQRRVEREREEAAGRHRSEADQQMQQAELAEHEAKRQRAEAELNAKRAEMHEKGLADDALPSGGMTNGRTEHGGHDRDHDIDQDRGRDEVRRDEVGRDEVRGDGGREVEVERVQREVRAEDGTPVQREDTGFREVSGGRAHEPDGQGGDGGARRFDRDEQPTEVERDREGRPLR